MYCIVEVLDEQVTHPPFAFYIDKTINNYPDTGGILSLPTLIPDQA
jgi:hypothetical protein